jgi:hypothetical protein
MPRQALLFANSVPPGLHGKGLSSATIRRTLSRFASVLSDLPGKYRFRVVQMVDKSPEKVRTTTSRLATLAHKSDDLFLLFYFGHAQLDSNSDLSFLHVPRKAGDRNNLPLIWLEHALSEAECKRSLFILDCCYAGAQPWRYDPPKGGEHCRIAATTPTSRAYIQANSLDEPIGFFTSSLIDAFASEIACVSVNDNSITTESLFRYVEAEVQQRTNSVQKPVLYGSIRRELTVHQPRPNLIPGINLTIDEKTTYRKVLAIIIVLYKNRALRDAQALHNRLLREYPREFETLVKKPNRTFAYEPVSITVTYRYLRFLEKLGIVGATRIRLSPVGIKMAQRSKASFNTILLGQIDQYLNLHRITREDIEQALRRILSSRDIPSKSKVLDYLALGRPTVSKDELGTIIDLLGHIKAIRMSDGRAYFPW